MSKLKIYDPRFNEFPIPDSPAEVIRRIVGWVHQVVTDDDGPGRAFSLDDGIAAFEDNWGIFVIKHFETHNNPWAQEWQSVANTALRHANNCTAIMNKYGHDHVSMDDFVEAGTEAAKYCRDRFGTSSRGCWCNNC